VSTVSVNALMGGPGAVVGVPGAVKVSAGRKQIPEPGSERPLERPCTVRARIVGTVHAVSSKYHTINIIQ
jgi:hypothetical protein